MQQTSLPVKFCLERLSAQLATQLVTAVQSVPAKVAAWESTAQPVRN